MRLGRQSTNIEDRRGMRMGPAMGGGIGGIAVLLIALFLGVDPGALLNSAPQGEPLTPADSAALANDPNRARVASVLGDTEDTWNAIFRDRFGRDYPAPELVLFTDAVQSACGFAQAAVGPFYCPADNKLYIDLEFFRDLHDKFRAPGDFAQAYVIAHEVGHHVQNQLGIAEQVRSLQARAGEREGNALQVRMELQADCFAGIWAATANRNRRLLEPGDVEEGLRAAAAVGDDLIQKRSRGYVSPESFTHGSSEQRMRWFRRGLESGDIRVCDTFAAREL